MLRARWNPYFSLFLGLVVLLLSSNGIAALAPAPPHMVWQFVPADGAVYGSALSDDGTELVAVIGFGFDAGGSIVALDPGNGTVRWLVDVPEGAFADPVVVEGVVYAGMGSLVGGGASVYAFDAGTGARLWRTDVKNRELPATPIDAITVADGKLYANRGDAVLLRLDAATGELEWERDLGKPARGAPMVHEDAIYVATGFDGGRVLAFDTATGDELWSVEDAVNPVTGPVLAAGHLLVPFVDGEIASYDPATGEERWRALAGVRDEAGDMEPWPGLPLVADGTVFVSSNGFAGAYTVALDLQTGQELWSTSTGDFSAQAPALFGDTLLVGSDSGDLLGLDPATGAELWRVAIPEKIDLDLNQASPPLVAGDSVFVLNDLGSVVALGDASLRVGIGVTVRSS